jgi:hypothetical protein
MSPFANSLQSDVNFDLFGSEISSLILNKSELFELASLIYELTRFLVVPGEHAVSLRNQYTGFLKTFYGQMGMG